jgi:hypothetical protein
MDKTILSEQAKLNLLVSIGIRNSASPEAIINVLVAVNEKLMADHMSLLCITPAKFIVNEKIYTWRCPDEFIPIAGQR